MRPLALRSFALLAALICCSEVSAQGTAADYERAAKLASRTRGKLLRAAVRPTWLSDSTLWYEVRTSPEQTEAVVIDASAPDGERRRVAATSETLRSQLGLRQAPRIEGLELDGEEIRLLLRGEAIGARRRGDGPLEAWDPIEAGDFHLRPSPYERASGNNGPETWILFVNREQEAVELQWVDSSGTRQSYGRIAPGGQRWMRTFAGHEWSLTGEGGRRLVGYRATAQSGIASTRLPTPDKESRQPRSERRRRGTPGMRRASSRSPDGKYEASTRDRAIVVTRKSNGREQALTNDTDEVTGYDRNTYWSADSRSLVVFRTIDPPSRRVTIVRALPKDEIQPRTETYAYRKPGDPIRTQAPRLFTRKGQRFEEVPIDLSQFENPWRLDMAGFEPDGDRFFVRYNQRGHRVLRMSAVDGRTGEVRTLVEEAPETFVDYNSKGFARWLDPGKGTALDVGAKRLQPPVPGACRREALRGDHADHVRRLAGLPGR